MFSFNETRRKIVTGATLAALAGISVLSAGTAIAQDAHGYFIDVLYLQDGKTIEDAKAYFDLVEPIVAKHGLVRIQPGLAVSGVMAGDADIDLINIWTITDFAETFPAIASDPAYREHIERRNSTFDMSRTQMFTAGAADF